jgi:hypothetical protein
MKGFALITILLLITLLLLLGSSFAVSMIIESKISQAQQKGIKAYYWAEAGINKAIWKLKNDPQWKESFETDPDWSATLKEESFTVQIQNLDKGKAEIVSTGYFEEGQRIVKTRVFKALNPFFAKNVALFSDGDTNISGSTINVQGGSTFNNDDLNVYLWSDVSISESALAADYIYVDSLSSLTAASKESQNYPPAPEKIEMPAVDFDSADENSYKNRADHIYSSAEFKKMLRDNPDLTIEGITYVTGLVQVKRGQHLTVNGVLVADGNIEIGTSWRGSGSAQVTVNYTPGEPAGLLTKARVWVGNWAGDLNIQGLLYANDRIVIAKSWRRGYDFNLEGGIIAQYFLISSFWDVFNITYNENIIQDTLSTSEFSPIITIEHWEEEY